MQEDPYVNFFGDEVAIVDFFNDNQAGRNIMAFIERELKSPSKPDEVPVVYFTMNTKQKKMYLLIVNTKKLPLDMPGYEKEIENMILLTATSTKTLLEYIDECCTKDAANEGIYQGIRALVSNSFKANAVALR